VHLDPCGLIMDYIRDPYDIPARFFADDDQEHTLRWRPASEGADVFPEPHKFGSLFNGYFNWVDGSHIGEVFKGSEPRRGLRAINRWFNNRPALGYDVGLTPCEPLESFRTGETFDEDRPPALYNEDGFPRCCLDRTVPRFGVEWGMRATTTVEPPNDTCLTARVLSDGISDTVTIPPGGERWWVFAVPFGTHWDISVTQTPFVASVNDEAIPQGGDCSGLVETGFFPMINNPHQVLGVTVFFAGWSKWVHLKNNRSIPVVMTVLVEEA
jgi:hypothetical protein